MNIKEEPLSASEGSGDEEDPLNFHSITLKRESIEWASEIEDVKPNLKLLNEALELNYSPKRLKCGKLHCEPCRVSFINDVYYERHASSLRHKLNIKLFRSGRAPTRKRGKSLIQAIMGNNYNCETLKKTGPFFCNQCPSAFKHARNLKTHQKKHLIQGQLSEQYQSSPSGSQDMFGVESSMQQYEKPSKPPVMLSAQNTRFVNHIGTTCDLCDQSFTTLPALLSHKRYCGRSENRVCRLCSQSFTTLSLFFRHRKECTKRFKKQSFDICQQQVNNVSPTVSPVLPNDGSVLACTLCNLSFETSADLIDHMQKNHMDFGKPQDLTELPDFAKPNHFSRTNDSRLHYCKYCLRSFTTHSALSSHTGYHARKSIYCCKFCRHSYRDKLTFRQHMKMHISNPNLNRNVCWICYTPFSSHKDLIEHKNIHAKIKMKIYSCDTCDNSYNTRELLAKHKRAAHETAQSATMYGDQDLGDEDITVPPKIQLIDEDNKLFKCRICKKRFTTLGNLKRHNLIHKRPQNMSSLGSTNIDHTYQNRCNWCTRTFKTQSGLLNHRPLCNRVKTTAVPNANSMVIGNSYNKSLKCKGCKKWFASKNSLYKHKVLKRCRITSANPIVQLRPQNCPNCDQQFLSEESLNRHKQLCKPTIERLTCDCGEVFPSVEQKLTHADSCHANCTCKFCNMKFNSPEELESHKSICQIQSQPSTSPQPSFVNDSRAAPLECHKCNKKFIYNKCLQMHLDKCLYDRWPCTHCMEIFSSETALATHKSHKTCQSSKFKKKSSLLTPQNESPTFKCEFCPSKFPTSSELRDHSFICENRPSMRQKDVNNVVYRPWSCDLCDKSFLWKANLWRHKKLIHKIVVKSRRSVTATDTTSGSPARTSQDGEREVFKCNFCPDIVFHKKQGFLEHQLAHERERSKNNTESIVEDGNNVLLTCELCDKKIPETLYPLHMDEHMNDDFEGSDVRNESMSGENYPCDICGKEFSTPISRKSHRATHYRSGDVMAHEMSPKKKARKIKVKHVRCPTCHKLLSINSMHKHRMMHIREEAEFYGENRNLVPIKSSVASTPRSVTPTVMSDVQSSPEGNEEEDTATIFPCPKCDGSFKLRKSLLEHLKGHAEDSMETESTSSATGPADQYQYKCVYCDLSWKYKSVFERHLTSKKHLEIQKQLSGII